MPVFMKDLANIFHQTTAIREIKNNMLPKSGLLHKNFFETYVGKCASQVQSTHFGQSKAQLSVFYFNTRNGTADQPVHKTFCTIA